MSKPLEINIHGIQCPNPNCQYEDGSVNFSDYTNWLNKPCPLCGTNLLTDADYTASQLLVNAAKSI